jgi:CheY-like chemotaxis protein
MSGQETLAALRKINPQVKALVSSGYSEPQVLQMFSGQPTVGFIQKPYTPVQLAEKIKKVLKNRL